MKRRRSIWLLLFTLLIILLIVFNKTLFRAFHSSDTGNQKKDSLLNEWHAPDINLISSKEEYELVVYGKELISNTSKYFGPKGTVAAAITNGMNCQNCHIDAGAKSYGNCFSAVAANYPQYRNRSGIIESIEFRINDCLQRSLNGKTIDSLSKEMRAIVAYLKWIGKDVPLKVKPKGSGTVDLPYLNRTADTVKGQIVYMNKCTICHGKKGEGVWNMDSSGYIYPPLWGNNCYNNGAGLYRLTRFAGYVKYNMPFKTASYTSPQLTDEEAWDVAAFVNSRPRPVKFFERDWPDITKKAIDYPYGPFADTFSATQHKYGPFEPINKAHKAMIKK
jgi:thiosulfate dehydrogenase